MLQITDDRPTLTGNRIRMEPLEARHAKPLWEAIAPGDITKWFPYPIRSLQQMETFVADAEAQRTAGTSIPFATIDLASGRPIGASRFMNIVRANRVVEIGSTFVAAAFQRTGVNREAKLLQLTHAFDVWKCNRVEFKTDSLNTRSREALSGIGAEAEGIFRNHVICHDGRLRHSAWFSITVEDWPACRERLSAHRQ
ncbi:MAG: GNAT family protein [Rhodospirillales bacterium]